jgi:hypothetical protein
MKQTRLFEESIIIYLSIKDLERLWGMVRKKTRSYIIAAGFVFIVVGAALALCSRPILTYTRNEVQEVPRSEPIINYSFIIQQSQNKAVPFQMNIGQNLTIFASGTGIFDFSIANFTDSSHLAQPDQPDVIYQSLENITNINTTWSPVARLAQTGSYYLVFLVLNASVETPVLIEANATKTWTEIKTIEVTYQSSVLDSRFAYIGLSLALFGGTIALIAFRASPRRSSKKQIGPKNISRASRSFRKPRARCIAS